MLEALAHETDSLTETDQRISELLERVSRCVRSDFVWKKDEQRLVSSGKSLEQA